MKSLEKICFGLFFTALILSFSVQLTAATMGVSRGHDLDMLWAKAQKQYDLKAHDAVLLLESRKVSIREDGNLVTRVHRVVWIGTEVGIEHHADLRIPWNSATSTFTVVALRTWNDGRWWPDESEVSETAVVETLPFALAQADDYTTMRETMLLHDGVELPCIMETIYEIEEEGAATEGSDGLWVFPQNDPAVLVEYRLSAPAAVTPVFRAGNGAPEPEQTTGADQATTYTWTMEHVDRLGSPRIEYPAVYAPHVIWSTWKDWTWLALKIHSVFEEAEELSEALADSLAKRLKHEQSYTSKEKVIVDLVSEWTRSIDYDWEFWQFAHRTATRTWETGYGHALDRAVLAAAFFRELKWGSRPCLIYRSGQYVEMYEDIPGLSCFDGIAVHGLRWDRVYDPVSGTMQDRSSWEVGRTTWSLWQLGLTLTPEFVEEGFHFVGGLKLILTLEPASEGGWRGKGLYHADNYFAPICQLRGLDNAVLPWLEEAVQSVLPGSHVKSYNPQSFSTSYMTLGFDFEMDAPEPDGNGRISFTIEDPANGIMSRLPRDVHLYEEHRSSPVLLDGRMEQRVKLRLKTGDREIVYLPEPFELRNEEGGFLLTVEREDDWITIERLLHLQRSIIQPDKWPLLRALLLEEDDPAHRTILLK